MNEHCYRHLHRLYTDTCLGSFALSSKSRIRREITNHLFYFRESRLLQCQCLDRKRSMLLLPYKMCEDYHSIGDCICTNCPWMFWPKGCLWRAASSPWENHDGLHFLWHQINTTYSISYASISNCSSEVAKIMEYLICSQSWILYAMTDMQLFESWGSWWSCILPLISLTACCHPLLILHSVIFTHVHFGIILPYLPQNDNLFQ